MARIRTIIWLAAATLLLAGNVSAATFEVNSTGSEPDLTLNDGVCLTVAGTCTFRAAIQQADAAPDFDTVDLTGITGTVSPGNALIFGNPVSIIGAGVTVDGSSLVSTTLRLNSPGGSVSGINFVNLPRAEIVADDTTFDSNTFDGTSQILVKAPNAVVTRNRVIGATDSLASVYVTPEGTSSVVEANVVGILADGTAEDAVPTVGIYTEASDVVISGNQVASHTYGIAGALGTGVTFSNNLVGGADGTMGASEYGIWSIELENSNFDSNLTNGNGLGGLVFSDGSGNNAVGNVSRGNGGPGILIEDEVLTIADSSVENNSHGIQANVAGSVFSRNRAVGNTTLAIDVGADGDTENADGDGVTNYPVLSTATGGTTVSIEGHIDAELDNADYTLEFFDTATCDDATGEGDAENFLGSIDITSSPDGTPTLFSATFAQAVAEGRFITATTTASSGTSELSDCEIVLAGPEGPITTAPAAPTAVSATAGNSAATVSWTAPSDNGGSAITDYTVTSAPDGQACTTAGATTCTVTGLTNGTEYTFTVIATNAEGDSLPSTASAGVTPAGPPSAPLQVQVESAERSLIVSWVASSDNGGSPVVGYRAQANPTCEVAALADEVPGETAYSCTIGNLDAEREYTVTVSAINAAGESPAVTAAGTPAPSREVLPVPILGTWALVSLMLLMFAVALPVLHRRGAI